MNVQQSSDESAAIPAIPAMPQRLSEPLPVVVVGTALFLIAAVLTGVLREEFGAAWVICVCGVGVGLLGAAVLSAQRRAARRGDRGAQQGLV